MAELTVAESGSNWDTEKLAQAQHVSSELFGAFAAAPLSEGVYYRSDDLDYLLPVADGYKTASQHWSDLRMYFQLRNGVDSDRQLVYTFARCADALVPNELSHSETVAKMARYMRAMQRGLQTRDGDQYRDRSETKIARMLHQSKAFIDGSPLLVFEQAIKNADLGYSPVRRVHNAAISIADVLQRNT